jgi:tetratricopeptide (TPR) repeat protein
MSFGIIGQLSLHGNYAVVLSHWLPPLCQSVDPITKGKALTLLGNQNYHLGDYASALDSFEQSLAIQQEIGDKSGEGATLNNISQIFKARGDYETALKYLNQSLAIQQEIGDVAGLCATSFNIGHIYWQNDQKKEAYENWVSAYNIAKKIGHAQALEALGSMAEQLELPGGLEGWETVLANLDKDGYDS